MIISIDFLFTLLNHIIFFIIFKKIYNAFIKEGLNDYFFESVSNKKLNNLYAEKKEELDIIILHLEEFKNKYNEDLLKIKTIGLFYQQNYNKKKI